MNGSGFVSGCWAAGKNIKQEEWELDVNEKRKEPQVRRGEACAMLCFAGLFCRVLGALCVGSDGGQACDDGVCMVVHAEVAAAAAVAGRGASYRVADDKRIRHLGHGGSTHCTHDASLNTMPDHCC